MKLSVVSPVYRADRIIEPLIASIHKAVSSLDCDYEIILVDDRSPDCSWDIIRSESLKDNRLHALRLSRNFGQHVAITAGLRAAQGDWIVVMDCDLQDDPSYIPLLLKEAQSGFDAVIARRLNRKHSWLKQLTSHLFYLIFSYLTEVRQDASIGNFGIYSKKLIQAVLSMGDYRRYFPAQVQWVGFIQQKIDLPHQSRHSGKSTYSLVKLISLAINNILAFSDKPLRLIVVFGILVSATSFMLGLGYLSLGLLGFISVSGFVSIIVSTFFSTGSIILVLGMVGLYVGKSFEASKNRPLFIVDEVI